MSSLRVGFDYLPAVAHAPGVGRYARELVRAAVRLEADCELRLLEWGRDPRPMEGAPLGLEGARLAVRRRRVPLPRRALDLARRLVCLGADDVLGGVDVFQRILPQHPPVRRAPSVLPVAELPTEGSEADRSLGEAARAAAGVVVFCGHYVAEVARRYGLDEARVHPVTVGSEHWLRDLGTRAPQPHPGPPVILVLGALRRERRPLLALRAFEQLRAGGGAAQLWLVGRAASAAAEFEAALERSPVRADVHWIREPREAHMPELVAGAACLLHLAQDEGSPVTPLEACALGPALVAERLPAFEEALGSLAHWVPRGPQPEALAEALDQALATLAGPGAPQQRLARQDLARDYTWKRCAEQHLRIWQELANRDP